MSKSYQIRGEVNQDLSILVDSAFFNWTVSIDFFSDEYLTPITPSEGEVSVFGSIPHSLSDSSFFGSPINSSNAGSTASAAAPLSLVLVAPEGVVGATHYTANITGTK